MVVRKTLSGRNEGVAVYRFFLCHRGLRGVDNNRNISLRSGNTEVGEDRSTSPRFSEICGGSSLLRITAKGKKFCFVQHMHLASIKTILNVQTYIRVRNSAKLLPFRSTLYKIRPAKSELWVAAEKRRVVCRGRNTK